MDGVKCHIRFLYAHQRKKLEFYCIKQILFRSGENEHRLYVFSVNRPFWMPSGWRKCHINFGFLIYPDIQRMNELVIYFRENSLFIFLDLITNNDKIY